jgi:hypothetical protein
MSKYRRTRLLHIIWKRSRGRAHVIFPGMKQRMEVPRDPFMGQTIVLPARFGTVITASSGTTHCRRVRGNGRSWIPNPGPKRRNHPHPNSTVPEAVKPWLERRQRIAAVVAGLPRTDECRREKCRRRSRGQRSSCSCSPPDQDTNSNHADGACIADRINSIFTSLDVRQSWIREHRTLLRFVEAARTVPHQVIFSALTASMRNRCRVYVMLRTGSFTGNAQALQSSLASEPY